MLRKHCIPSILSRHKFLLIIACLCFASQVFAQAKIIAIDGGETTYRVEGQHGQQVKVTVPSVTQLRTDANDEIHGTVVALNQPLYQMQIHTTAGQTVMLEVSPTVFASLNIGDSFTLKQLK